MASCEKASCAMASCGASCEASCGSTCEASCRASCVIAPNCTKYNESMNMVMSELCADY